LLLPTRVARIARSHAAVNQLNLGQLADYIAMLGLAEIRLDGDFDGISTILRLFERSGDPPPQSLTQWDQAFLYSLYDTQQASMQQPSMIRTSMVDRMAHQ
jgi:hypothetical protein